MKNLYLILTILILFSCKESDKNQLKRLVVEWQGKEILFPQDIVYTKYAKDTIDWDIPESDFKILMYVDSMGCISCKLQMDRWKELITEFDSITGRSVPFIFFFQPKDVDELNYLLRRDRFDYPVCIDVDNQIDKLNDFPNRPAYQTFLLDKDNKVVVIGNPVHNLAIKELFLKKITGNRSSSSGTTTEAIIEHPEVEMGSFSKSEKRKAVFTLKNTGDNPLVILGTTTTCGCAAVNYDKQPAQPGEALTVEVEMSPKDSGFFDETITVKCNTDQVYRLKIRGEAM